MSRIVRVGDLCTLDRLYRSGVTIAPPASFARPRRDGASHVRCVSCLGLVFDAGRSSVVAFACACLVARACARCRSFVAGYLVDPASSHMLVSKIKPCMSKYKRLVL